jgi:hypothetical protein
MRPDTTGPPPFGTRRCGHERENGLVLCIADSRPDRGAVRPVQGRRKYLRRAPARQRLEPGLRPGDLGAAFHRSERPSMASAWLRCKETALKRPSGFPPRVKMRAYLYLSAAAGTRRYDALIETPTF